MQNLVRVYWNSRRKVFSIQSRVKVLLAPPINSLDMYNDPFELVDIKEKYIWRVTNYADNISLTRTQFKVSEAGRKRVLRTKTKNVHAYLEGCKLGPQSHLDGDLRTVSYNPYKNRFFVDQTGLRVDYANMVFLTVEHGHPVIKATER